MSDQRPIDLSAILDYCQKATPGPWSARPGEDNYDEELAEDSWGSIKTADNHWHIARVWNDGNNAFEADAHLLANSRSDLPAVTEALIEALRLLDTEPDTASIFEILPWEDRRRAILARFAGWERKSGEKP